MSRVALVYSHHFTRHQTGEISLCGDDLLHHLGDLELIDPVYTVAKLQYPYPVPGRVPNPEQPARVTVCYETLSAFGLIGEGQNQLRMFEPRPASLEELLTVHSSEYITRVDELSRHGGGELAESTYIGSQSYEWASLSAGAGLTALELLQSNQADSALVLTRPPGHHAHRTDGAGFCVFNNVALLAETCRRQGYNRVLIIDWDLHHGDGTQSIFYDNPDVLFCSLHQFGPELYPEKGDFHEIGVGSGQGYTVNLPLPAKIGDADYLHLFERVIPVLADSFRPDIILVSAGYDAHFNDTQNPYVWAPAGGLSLSAQTYTALTHLVADCAVRYCQGRYIILLEGGYNLYCLPSGLVNTAAAMLGHPPLVVETVPSTVPITPLDIETYLAKLQKHHPTLKFVSQI
jgi:acetoin utilization deacetylase AcuC-like enzyme